MTKPVTLHRPKKKPGPARLVVDMALVEDLCAHGCTHAEIADLLRISKRTLEYWLEDEKTTYTIQHKPKTGEKPSAPESLTLRAIFDRGYAQMRTSIRRQQMALLADGNATMAVWLGKQYLGQTDRMRVEAPAAVEAKAKQSITLEELLTLYRK